MNLIAAVAVAVAALLWAPQAPRRRLNRLARRERRVFSVVRLPRLLALAAVGGCTVGALALFGTPGAAVGFCSALVATTVVWIWRQHLRDQRAVRNREGIVEACQLLAGLLRVGHVPVVALRIAAADSPILVEAAAAQQVGASVAGVLRRQGTDPGSAGLAELAVAWEVAERSGASMTATLDALADRLDSARKVVRMVSSELAAPRATGRLLAALPLFGLALGFGIGGNPAEFLLGSLLGQGCLVGGVCLACVGVWWIERIARQAGG